VFDPQNFLFLWGVLCHWIPQGTCQMSFESVMVHDCDRQQTTLRRNV